MKTIKLTIIRGTEKYLSLKKLREKCLYKKCENELETKEDTQIENVTT